MGPLIETDYDDVAASIRSELDQFSQQHEALRKEMRTVLEENKSLSSRLKSELDERLSAPVDTVVVGLNRNLQQQAELCLKEKEFAVEMWHMSQEVVTALENELKDYRNNTNIVSAMSGVDEVREHYSQAIKLLESKVSRLEGIINRERSQKEILEKHLTQTQNDHKEILARLEKRSSELDRALIGQQAAHSRAERLEKERMDALTEAKEAVLSRDEMQAALTSATQRLEAAVTNEAEARDKVEEALQIVETAMADREIAHRQLADAQGESAQLRSSLAQLVQEAGQQVQVEAERLKQLYNAQLRVATLDIQRLQEENKSKTEQLQKMRADWNSMEDKLKLAQRELEAIHRDKPLLSSLDRKIDGLFRAHDIAGEEVIRAELKREELKAEIIKLKQSHELEIRQCVVERSRFEEQVRALQHELHRAAESTSDATARLEVLTSTLRDRDRQIASLRSAMQIATDSKNAQDKFDVAAALQLREELEKQLDIQHQLTNKWKKEAYDITSRFQARLQELRSEAATLRRENRELRKQLSQIHARYELVSERPSKLWRNDSRGVTEVYHGSGDFA